MLHTDCASGGLSSLSFVRRQREKRRRQFSLALRTHGKFARIPNCCGLNAIKRGFREDEWQRNSEVLAGIVGFHTWRAEARTSGACAQHCHTLPPVTALFSSFSLAARLAQCSSSHNIESALFLGGGRICVPVLFFLCSLEASHISYRGLSNWNRAAAAPISQILLPTSCNVRLALTYL